MIEFIEEEIKSCTRCILRVDRTYPVPGDGPSKADIMCVGEAPGKKEDESGHPFIGPSGNLFSRLLKDGGFDRSEIFITNIVKCRPPGNRNPTLQEIRTCFGFLTRQIETIQPKVIFSFGKIATQSLTSQFGKMSTLMEMDNLHCKTSKFHIPVIPFYHPRYFLGKLKGPDRDPNKAREIYQDYLQRFQMASRVISGEEVKIPEEEIDLSFL